MQGPPPPLPNLDPAGSAAQVREATPEEADRFRRHDVEEIARKAYDAVHGMADAHATAEEKRDGILRELDEATTALAREASTPVIDERDQRRRTRERHR